MDIQYVGEGRPADKKITFHSDVTHKDETITVKFKYVAITNRWLVINVPDAAAERLLVSPNFKEFKEEGHGTESKSAKQVRQSNVGMARRKTS